MKVKIAFDIIDYAGRSSADEIPIECPDFEEQKDIHHNKLINNEYQDIELTYTVEQQILSWLDEMDKTEMMAQNNWSIIVNYALVFNKEQSKMMDKISKNRRKTKLEMILDAFDSIEDEKLRDDYKAAYTKMQPSISMLSAERQIIITSASIDVGYLAQKVIIDRVLGILQGKEDSQDDISQLDSNSTLLLNQ